MTTEQIDNFLKKNNFETATIKISFKTRKPHIGRFLRTEDFNELKAKNFWRIVGEISLDAYKDSGDSQLARIFNGAEFTKLSLAEQQV
jgi:hypothetical protein